MAPDEDEHAALAAALTYHEAGDSAAAIALLRDAIRANPNNALYHFRLGVIHLHTQDQPRAEASFREALRLDPKISDVPLRLGIECARNGMLEEAEDCLRLTLGFGRDNPPALACLGDVLRRTGREREALDLLQAAAHAAPESCDVLLNLGIALHEAERLEESVDALEKAQRLNPADVRVCNNLGVTLKQLGRLGESMWHLNEAVRIAPGFAEARLNRAMLLLLTGDFEQGWPEYEWRPKCAVSPWRPLSEHLRAGLSLAGKTILLHAEQGLGDLIQFVRYAEWLEQRGAKVLVECPAPAQELIRGARGVAGVMARGTLPDFDLNAHLLSMPGLAHPREGFLRREIPYLNCDPHRVAFWKERLQNGGRIRVGLVWAGSASNANDRRRSMPAAELEPIVKHPAVTAYALQIGPRASDLPPEWGVTNLEAGAANAAETAAMMMSLDLIVSVDTMPAHLAGALGRPVWVLLPFVPDWRWRMTGQDTPWYPNMRLFRQSRPGDWKGVVASVARELPVD